MASSQSASAAAADGRIRRRYGSIMSRRPLPIRYELGDPPPPLWRRFVHWWRYGSYHPDEDLLGVIDAAIDSLTMQIKSAEGVLTGARREKLDAIRAELNTELNDEVPELAILLGIEAKINALYPPSLQKRRAWMIQDRFQRIAPGQAAEYWRTDLGDIVLTDEHDERMRRADEAVAAAVATELAAGNALTAAEQDLNSAAAAFEAARGQLAESDDQLAGELDRLETLRASAPDDPARTDIEQRLGALLDAASARDAAVSSRDSATARNVEAEWAASAARLDRELVQARCELERLQARLRGSERAASERPGQAGAAAVLVESIRQEAAEAQRRVDAAAAAVQVNAAARPGSPAAEGAAPEEFGGTGDERNGMPGGPATTGSATGDADAQTLLGYIHTSYLMGIARERAVRDLMRWLMMRFWTANLIMVVALVIVWRVLELSSDYEQFAPLIFGLFLIASIGRVGATMSVVQRLQGAIANNVLASDPIQELTRLRTGKNGINLALFSGGVFALLTYAFFASGVPALLGFDEGVAPAIATIQEDQDAQAENEVAAETLSRAARNLADQEATVRGLEAELDSANGPAPDREPETQPLERESPADPTAADQPTGPPETTAGQTAPADRQRVDDLEARLNEARAVLDQHRAALSVAAGAAGQSTDRGETEDRQGNADGKESNSGQPREGDAPSAKGSPDRRQTPPASAQNAPAGQGGKPTGEGASGEPAANGQCDAKDDCDPFVRLAGALGLNAREDFFKLLIWAFLAGFAERLVPDALDTIANRARRRRRLAGQGDETA